MDTLPIGVIDKIISLLDLDDQINCRLVCQSFKNSVDFNLKRVTHLSFTNEIYKTWHYHSYYVYKKFLHQPFTICPSTHYYNLLPFLAKKGSNLQVIYGPKYRVRLNDLLLFGKSLKFFSLDTNFPCNNEITDELFDQFHQLEGFDIYYAHDSYINNLFVKKLASQEKPIIHIQNLNEELLESIEPTKLLGVESLDFQFVYIPQSYIRYSLTSDIAEQLRCLSVSSCNVDVDGPFLNLEYLSLFDFHYLSKQLVQRIFSSRKLERIYCVQRSWPLSSIDLLNQLNMFQLLKYAVFDLKIYNDEEYGSKIPPGTTVTVSLPRKIQVLILNVDVSCEITRPESLSLTRFECNPLSTFKFDFPCLEELKIKVGPWDNERAHFLLHSLVNCSKLKKFEFNLSENRPEPSYVQSMLTLMERLVQLKEVTLLSSGKIDDDDTTKPTVIVKQSSIPSVEGFYWSLPLKVDFYPSDSQLMKPLRLQRAIKYWNREKEICFHFELHSLVNLVDSHEDKKQLNL